MPAVLRAVGPGKARRCQRGRACIPAASSSLGGRCRDEGEAARALRQEGSPRKVGEQANEEMPFVCRDDCPDEAARRAVEWGESARCRARILASRAAAD